MTELAGSRQSERDVVIIGGGLAGLTCARALVAAGTDTLLLESTGRLGGRVRTSRELGYPVELGASFIAGFYQRLRDLISEMGLKSGTDSDSQETWVSRSDGRTGPVWPAAALLTSPVVSLGARVGAVRGITKLMIDARGIGPLEAESVQHLDDASVDQWVEQWFGREMAQVVISPLLRALFFWDPAHTSRALLPLILKGVSIDRHFYRLPAGMDSITRGLQGGIDVRLGAGVSTVRSTSAGFEVSGSFDSVVARAVVFACPAVATVEILRASNQPTPESLADVRYSRVQAGIIGFGRERPWPLESRRSVVFADGASTNLVAIKPVFAHPSGGVDAFRFYWTGHGSLAQGPELVDAVRSELLHAKQVEMAMLLDQDARLVDLVEWAQALPLFDVGYVSRLVKGELSSGLSDGLFLAGDFMVAPHLEGAIESGQRAAASVAKYLSVHS